jgi:hypothetical protein
MHFTERERTHTHHAFYRERAHTHTQYLERESAHTHTTYLERGSSHTPYILQERRLCTKHSYAHIHTAIINRKYSMQMRAPHLLQSLLRFLCSCAEAKCVQRSGHGLTSCAAIDDSRKVEYVHREYSLQNTLHRNLRPLQRALTSVPSLPKAPGT